MSIEDAQGGAFDDVVVRSRAGSGLAHEYTQVKSSNYRNTVVNETWLLTSPSPRGKCPLAHFYATWARLTATGEPFTLTLLSNRNYDHADPILNLIDNSTDTIPREALDRLRPRSAGGKALERWSASLQISIEELAQFLSEVRLVHGEADTSWLERCRPLMQQAGLRNDDAALDVGRAMVRNWVTAGRGARTRDEIRAEVAERDLLARRGTLVLAVHAIDHAPIPELPNVTIDIVDHYPDVDPFQRRQLSNPNAWPTIVIPKLNKARTELGAFRSRRVHVVGAMRLPLYFAVGRTLPEVAGWVLSVDQRGEEWATSAAREGANLDIQSDEHVKGAAELAVAIALTHNPVAEVRRCLSETAIPAERLLVLSRDGGPSQNAVPGPGWAIDWATRARDAVRSATSETGAQRVHLFIAAPAGLALFLGHQWNLVPTTVVYEHLAPGYAPTITFAG
ncbi:SAVED domain-containing protein [Myceligenerans xiligouense]|uniref:SAVED domain-containing protein n=1 Tax=Myceligenerans xiligouense TaxID=253184 RepID=UPI00147753DD|nr:SAVED domain-containing protein [Myceligenerans xiligouense]